MFHSRVRMLICVGLSLACFNVVCAGPSYVSRNEMDEDAHYISEDDIPLKDAAENEIPHTFEDEERPIFGEEEGSIEDNRDKEIALEEEEGVKEEVAKEEADRDEIIPNHVDEKPEEGIEGVLIHTENDEEDTDDDKINVDEEDVVFMGEPKQRRFPYNWFDKIRTYFQKFKRN